VPLRKILFWLHLSAGVIAGAIVLLMSVTGVVLTYEKQLIQWADARNLHLAENAGRIPLDELLRQSGRGATAVTVYRDAKQPVVLQLDGGKRLLLDPYTGAALGAGNESMRDFLRTTMELHRWLGASGESRATGRAITGACNLAFLGLIFTGAYLWLPKAFTSKHLRPIVWFRGGLSSKARDFNWHNVIGLWCFLPLLVIVASGAVISYKWAGDLVYRAVGEVPPRPAPSAATVAIDPDAIAQAYRTAASGDWKSITLRAAGDASRVTATVDRGYAGQPQLRTTLTVDAATGAILSTENFDSLSKGRRARYWLRFLHTGEALGIAGQTLAGIASLGAAVLVYTGIALSLRRFTAWRRRRAALEIEPDALREREIA
jgi:uncharacterized iron-regulated membrane protein